MSKAPPRYRLHKSPHGFAPFIVDGVKDVTLSPEEVCSLLNVLEEITHKINEAAGVHP